MSSRASDQKHIRVCVRGTALVGTGSRQRFPTVGDLWRPECVRRDNGRLSPVDECPDSRCGRPLLSYRHSG